MPDAAVPAAVVPSGKPTDALAVRQFLAAGGTPHALADATAYSIRSSAMRPDGTLDPAKVRAWITRNGEALAQMPPEVASRFRNVADAQAAVDAMVAQRERDLAAFQRTAVARIASLQHGEDVVKTVGGIFGAKDAVGQMKALADAAASDPAAKEGLRRAVVEHLLGVLTSNAFVNASGISQIRGDALSRTPWEGSMREQGSLTRRSLVQAAPATVVAGALPALAAGTGAEAALRAPGSSKLQALGKAWAINLEQQKAAQAECKRYAGDAAACQRADARRTALMSEEVDLSRAMWSEPASSPEDLALKARVILRAISLSDATFADPARIPSVDEWELDEEQGIAASLALDLIRLSGSAGGADA